MAVTGSGWTGARRSMTVAYTFDSVLKAVGSLGSTMTILRADVNFDVEAWDVLIWRLGRRGLFWSVAMAG